MLCEEATAEGAEPFPDGLLVVGADLHAEFVGLVVGLLDEGLLGEVKNLGGTESEAQEVIEEEVVELVRSDEVFGLL